MVEATPRRPKSRVWLVAGVVLVVVLGLAAINFRFLLQSFFHLDWGADPGPLGLRHVEDVPLEGGASRFDYQAIDAARGLLFVTHLGGDQVVVFDLHRDRVATYVTEVASPHGVAIAPDRGLAFVSATGSHEVVAIDEATFQVLWRAPAGSFPDGLAYDPGSNRLFVSDEAGGHDTVIDVATHQAVASIDLGGEVGNTQLDPVGHQVIAAAQGKGEVAFIDPESATVKAWASVPDCSGPHGFYVDSPARRAYVSCEGNARLVVLDLETRSAVAQVSIGDVPDVLAYDAGTHRLFIAAESGVVAVYDTQTQQRVGLSYLAPAAHSIAVDLETHEVYVPLEDVGGKPVLRIYDQV